ncbi:LysR family transcriptional regulator [Roseovarius indicus]|uniref:HTH-type transcriptional activator AllS n=1 Tax=Roseovarius indicus TaxID=540747 RepID=A0A5P3A9I1_9RHOB|nr:LysR family transcriptional regulator [Roseovarius indicus]OAO07701.1 hypothetical protein A8B76_07165 [Roseovarius indicus]QEW25048.1 HTH-type transcriptional activator AllS [Roseovarius indicus]SFE39304.1 DNA-binding transcriptional regulator, LysR family [Roseovarius indicus]
MLNRVTIDQLHMLAAVAECGSFSAAARRLNRVQSAVSQSIQSLEDALEVKLFDRSHKLPRLTDAGEAILIDARRVIGGVDALRARARSIATVAEPEITLAIEQVFPNEVLIGALKAFHEEYPSVSVTLYGEGLGAPEQSLHEGNAGLAIYSPARDGMPGVQMEFFGNVPISFVASARHPLARIGGPISQAQLDEHVQLTLTDRTRRFRGVVMSERTWSFIDQFNRLDFVLNGFGWCVMPTHLAWPHIENGDLCELKIAIHRGKPLRFPLYTAHKADQPPGPAATWLLGELRSRFADWIAARSAWQGTGEGIQVRVTAT